LFLSFGVSCLLAGLGQPFFVCHQLLWFGLSFINLASAVLMGAGSDHWHTKPTEEETLFSPLQFHSSRHDQPSELS